jgi:hypothetical protein
MAHFFANGREPRLPSFFNVDGVVGANPATNSPEDVLLVQFFMRFALDKTSYQGISPNDARVIGALRVTGVCDQATVDVIYLSQYYRKQETPSVVADGRISPARAGGEYSKDSKWTIITLNYRVKELTKDVWPRIDKIPGCPPQLTQMVARTLVGTT